VSRSVHQQGSSPELLSLNAKPFMGPSVASHLLLTVCSVPFLTCCRPSGPAQDMLKKGSTVLFTTTCCQARQTHPQSRSPYS
jgi:hypothetical protein